MADFKREQSLEAGGDAPDEFADQVGAVGPAVEGEARVVLDFA
jgi:hypothetical protein